MDALVCPGRFRVSSMLAVVKQAILITKATLSNPPSRPYTFLTHPLPIYQESATVLTLSRKLLLFVQFSHTGLFLDALKQ